MDRRVNTHINSVLVNEMKKQDAQDHLESTNEEKRKQWLETKEKIEKETRQNGLNNMHNVN